jgi:hypothetical protein
MVLDSWSNWNLEMLIFTMEVVEHEKSLRGAGGIANVKLALFIF